MIATRLAVLATGAVAIACCVGLPALGAALGGATAGMLIGGATGLVGTVVLGIAAIGLLRDRRRRDRLGGRG